MEELGGHLLADSNPISPGIRSRAHLSGRIAGVHDSNPTTPKELLEWAADVQDQQEALLLDGMESGLEEASKWSALLPAMSITFKDVAFRIRAPHPLTGEIVDKTILEPCAGHYEPGQLVAIMGPSGCGKSTLLDILAGKKTQKFEGEVFLNGRPRDRLFHRVTAYVPQADVMPAYWLVKEAVAFNQALTIQRPSNVPRDVMAERARLILRDLGLDGVADTKIGSESVRGISGGQRRRVTLARGLVSAASIIFCDEPTSGLSSTDAEVCVRRMQLMVSAIRHTGHLRCTWRRSRAAPQPHPGSGRGSRAHARVARRRPSGAQARRHHARRHPPAQAGGGRHV